MKKFNILIFVISFFIFRSEGFADECVLNSKLKNKLMKDSPYGVDDVECGKEGYKWDISNKRHLKTKVIKEEVVAIPKVEAVPAKRFISFVPGLDEWNISALYGARHNSISQSGALGKAEVGEIFLNDLQLHSEFIFEDWGFNLNFDTYSFKYASSGKNDSKRMRAMDFLLSYKWFALGFGFDQTPLFRNNGGAIEMVKQNFSEALVGISKTFPLPTRKPTSLKLEALAAIPVSSNTEDSNVEISNQSGVSFKGKIELKREILVKDTYSVYATWITDMKYQNFSQDIKWDVSAGKVDSKIIQTTTALGLMVSF